MSLLLEYPPTHRLWLIYTLQCNLCCSHCLVNSDRNRSETLSREIAFRIIKSSGKLGYQLIHFTGGEVVVYCYQDILECMKLSKSLGMKNIVETNGSWAIEETAARKILVELKSAGMDCIATSFDAYHAEQMNLDNVLRIFQIAKSLNIPNRITLEESGDPEKDQQLKARLEVLNIEYFWEPVMLIGRGSSLKEKYPGIRVMQQCDSIGTTIFPNGDVFSCCGVNDESHEMKNTPFYSGNIFASGILQVLQKDFENPVKHRMIQLGHEALWRETFCRDNQSPGNFVCHDCLRLLKKMGQTDKKIYKYSKV